MAIVRPVTGRGAGIPVPVRRTGEGKRHDNIDPGDGWYRYARAARDAAAARCRCQRDRPQPLRWLGQSPTSVAGWSPI